MKLRLSILFIILLFTLSDLSAQPFTIQIKDLEQERQLSPEEREERVIVMQSTYVISALKLGDKKKEEYFSLLYKKYLKEIYLIKQNPGNVNRANATSDKQIDSIITSGFRNNMAILKLQEKYFSQFRKILSAREVAIVYHKENEILGRMTSVLYSRSTTPTGLGSSVVYSSGTIYSANRPRGATISNQQAAAYNTKYPNRSTQKAPDSNVQTDTLWKKRPGSSISFEQIVVLKTDLDGVKYFILSKYPKNFPKINLEGVMAPDTLWRKRPRMEATFDPIILPRYMVEAIVKKGNEHKRNKTFISNGQ